MCSVSITGSNKTTVHHLKPSRFKFKLNPNMHLPLPLTSPPATFTEHGARTRAHVRTSMHQAAHAGGPAKPTAPIKACAASETAVGKSQPRAHLFKPRNNEFFVASHLPITINLAFRRYVHGTANYQGLHHGSSHRRLIHDGFTASHPEDANCD